MVSDMKKKTKYPKERASPHFIDRSVIVSAALKIFSTSGFHGASMRQMAAAAETSISNIYNYFGSKDELLAFVLEETASTLADRLEEAVRSGRDDAATQLAAAVDAYVAYIVDEPEASLIGITEFRYLAGKFREEVVYQRDRTEQVFSSIIARGVEAGDFRVPDISSATRAVVTVCNSMSTWYRADGRLAPEELAEQQIELCLNMVRAS